MPNLSHPSRRQFLTAATATLAIPTILPRSVFGANERIVTGHIGVRNQGTANLKAFLDPKLTTLVSPAAMCDVDSRHLKTAIEIVEKSREKKKCDGYDDYRKVLDRKDIDAVVISTPDHWHALMEIHACQAGKDVYCEKPLSLTIREGRQMVEAARANNRIVQTGSQQRSSPGFREVCELVRSGRIGKVQKVLVGIPKVNFEGDALPDSAPPTYLNYDRWLGPALYRPYNSKRVHYLFRFFWDYSGGQMTNFGAHNIDIAQWGLGTDDTGPISTEATATFDPQHKFEVPNSCRVTHTYANGVTLIIGQDQPDIRGGTTFIGTDGTLFVDRSKKTSTPSTILKTPLSEGDVHLYESTNHYQNFLDCVKSRKTPICDVEIGHRSATICHLGNIAIRLGRKVQWDPAAERIIGDDEAAAMASRPHRSPYTI
ncbi:Gfo/Idh/MocA family protein [Singulisphaera acidiphila]|uniref:Putative dehydrogenase n=1 Tax=Singulisphaera acidiphila (strain ATCC BAA-1392 / DSM 18658 / VKM B-2454 / MOB10) TaxID=886293 RepID=L0D9Q1_SINAD|nr:Gfo/Idh/MocA family oxidoreductase [Singulisphaera acidiphila]AGA25361.1 putative dehydrogenase [Singulisphaera acidiphila DSM 18658]